jgi:hypothetical protein
MLDSVKNKAVKSALLELLKFVVEATKSEAGHGFVPLEEANKLAKAEPDFIVIDANTKNEGGQVKVTATQKAIDAVAPASSETKTATEQKPVATPMQYERVSLDVLPEIKRGNPKSDSYPFESLKSPAENGGKFDAFFVPATAARPKPSKSLASTVASATKRYKAKDQREFTLRKKMSDDGKTELGAYVIRKS